MTRSEALVRSVLGPCRRGIRPFVCAIDRTIEHSFAINSPIEDLQVSKVVYTEVARHLNISWGAATRQIERIANDCWARGNRERLNEIFGRPLPSRPPPRDMLFYFAAYTFYGVSFHELIEQHLTPLP